MKNFETRFAELRTAFNALKFYAPDDLREIANELVDLSVDCATKRAKLFQDRDCLLEGRHRDFRLARKLRERALQCRRISEALEKCADELDAWEPDKNDIRDFMEDTGCARSEAWRHLCKGHVAETPCDVDWDLKGEDDD